MIFKIAEGNCCKDSQDLNVRHATGTVNPPHLNDEENFGIDFNEKIDRRNDYRRKKYNNSRKIRIKCKNKIIRPHSENLYSSFIKQLKSLDSSLATELLECVLVAVLVQLRKSSLERVIIIVSKLLKSHFGFKYSDIISKTLISERFAFIKNISKWTLEDLEKYIKELLDNWKLAHKNEAFGSIVTLISTFLAVFYSADKKWSFSVGAFSMFLFDAKNSCKEATGLIDAILKVATYIISGLQKYTSTGTLTGFLYADDQLGELDSTVLKLQEQFSFIRTGNLEKLSGIDENTFDQELQNAILDGQKMILLYDGVTKKFVMDKVRILQQIHCDFIQTRASGGLRIAPFAFLLAGSTGLGKSSINEALMRYLLAVNGYNHQDQFIVTLNSQDKYFSTYRSYINGVIFDDFANVSKDFVEESPCDTLLKFVNNVPYYLNMAELELKGRVVAEPKIIGITTNVSDIDSSIYSNQASSIMRRMKAHIYAKVKPEFRKEGSVEIDPSKVHDKYGDDLLTPDIWLFDVMVVKVIAIDRKPKLSEGDIQPHRDDPWKLEYVQWNGKPMKNATINELLLYMKGATATHFKEQISLVTRNKLYSGEIVCESCKSFFEHCVCSNSVDEANATIADLQNIVTEFDDIINNRSTDVDIQPHGLSIDSLSSSIYPELLLERNRSIEQNLKSMLQSWLLEGKYNFDSTWNQFISNCNTEIQYLLIVLRRVAENWFKRNRHKITEAFFPMEFEDTRIGDYYTIVVRKKELDNVLLFSNVIETLLRVNMFSLVYFFHTRGIYVNWIKYLLPIISNYYLDAVDFPKLILKLYNSTRVKIVAMQNRMSENFTFPIIRVIPFLILVLVSYLLQNDMRFFYQLIILIIVSFYPLFYSNKYNRMYGAPRALSLLYKKEKESYYNKWTNIAPTLLTMSVLYYNKDDIIDFYVEAFERWFMQPHSRLDPSAEEVEERDKKYKFDDRWFKESAEPFLDPLPTTTLRTPEEVRNAIGDNVWYIENLDTKSQTNCFVICSGCILIPYHFVPRKSNLLKFTRHNKGNKGNKSFQAYVDPSQCIRIKHYDLSLMWMPKTRDVRNMIDFLPKEFHETKDDRTGRIVTRDIDGNLEWSDVREFLFTNSATSGMGYTFPGAFYIWNNAREGKCLSPVITDDKNACISSFHIGGSTKPRNDGGYIAFGVTPTQEDILEAKRALEQCSTVIPMSSMSDFSTEVMGVSVLDRTIKKKSCYLRMEDDNTAYFLGSSFNCNRAPKSQVRDTPIKQDVKLLFNVSEEWGSPKFKGHDGKSPHEPWEVGMKKWIVDKPGLPFNLLNKAKTDYTNNMVRIMCKEMDFWKRDIRPLTWDETVNGIPGKRFIDSINFQSSIGFPFKGSKTLFSKSLGEQGQWQDKRELDPEFIIEAEKIEELYKQGKRYYPWFTSTFKDEPTLSDKDKVRIFQASSTPFQLVMRKYTLGICRFFQMNPLESECAVGIDPCSNEWDEMAKHMINMQTPLYDRWFAIDYKAYDTSISSQAIIAVGRIFIDLAKIAGYNGTDIKILQSIFTELSFSIVDFNGDVLMLDGCNPSGNSLTVFINNLCNSLLMRIYFYHLYPNRKFSDYVRIMCYGDDLIASVNAKACSFTMKGYAEFLKKYGYTVTPAQKDAKLKNFAKMSEIDFLKRKFIKDKNYGAYIAPLDELSIYKRLCNYMTSETAVEVIVGSNIDGALDEWAFYGKKIYLDRQAKLIKIIEKYSLHRFVHRVYFTYEERVSLWKQQYADPAVMGKGQNMDTDSGDCDKSELGFFGWGNILSKIGMGGPPISHNSTSYSSNDEMSINKRTSNIKNLVCVKTQKSRVIEELKLQKWDIIPHSVSFSRVREENVTMVDGSANQIVNIPSALDETRFCVDSSDNSLGAFMSRPIRIASFDWSPASMFLQEIDPWNLFLSNKRIINKIATYKLFRGNLKLKILINGNAMYYGRLMASYWPFANLDNMTINGADSFYHTQFSQMPTVYLDPTLSQGGEMFLPFFWHNDYLDLTFEDRTRLGRLVFRELNPLKHTSGDVTTSARVAITVYAWMENVQLEAPTTTNPYQIVPQSTNVEPKEFVIPRAMANTCLIDTVDTSNKLTFTSDQEVTSDPEITGYNHSNELSIAGIASRESYLTTFNWPRSAASDNLLFNIRVTPALWAIKSLGESQNAIAFTACCGACLPFEYWTGSFKLRLQFVTSAFHRGRIAIVYDPHAASSVREDNATYTEIVDISTCRDVTFCVNPNQDRILLTRDIPGDPLIDNNIVNYGTTLLQHRSTGNGVIAVYVLNELTLPNALSTVNNDIQVNVFVSMGDDFQVFTPSSTYHNYTVRPQSTGVIGNEVPDLIQESNVDHVEILDQKTNRSSKISKVYIGENITSFKQLLQRYSLWTAFRVDPVAVNTVRYFLLTHRIFPAYRGYVANAIHTTTASTAPYNYMQMTLLNYLAPAFQGWRGSVKYKIVPRCIPVTGPQRGTVYISERRQASWSDTLVTVDLSNKNTAASSIFLSGSGTKSRGVVALEQDVNSVIEYEIPWYENFRFNPGKPIDWTSISGTRNAYDRGVQVAFDTINSVAGLRDIMVAAGKDFNFYFFTGWPIMYYNPTIPPPGPPPGA